MDEREKMLAGQWYDANNDDELIEARQRADLLCHTFNAALPKSAEQHGALRELLGTTLPEGLEILAPVYFDYGSSTSFGAHTFVNRGCYFMDGGRIHVGRNVFIGPYCGFYTATHPLDSAKRNQGIEQALPIIVGDDCWIGAHACILQGVTIGEGSVVAAGSVVTRDVAPHTMVAGVPATEKKRLA